MQTYKHYKDSGIDWIGQIPAHWECKRLGNWFEERRKKVSDKDFAPLSVTKNGIVPQLDSAAKSNDGDNRKLVMAGDFVINSRSDRKGSSGLSYLDGSVSLINIVMKPRGIYPKFSEFLLKSNGFIEEFYRNGHGIVADLWTTRYDEMKFIFLAIPPIEEQEAIANFLDEKTTKIDALVQTKEQQIEKLKELRQAKIHQAVTKGLDANAPTKDSGVEWIGEIPAHWEVKRLKHIKKTIRNAFVDGPFGSNLKSEHFVENGDVFVIESGSITKGYFISNNFKTITQEHFNTISRSECIEGDLIIAKIGAYYGMCAELPLLLKRSVVSGNSLKLTLNNLIANTQFYIYLLNDIRLNDIYNRLGIVNSSAQPALSLGTLNNLNIIFPPIQEQEQIVAYLDEVTGKIDQAITQKQEQITKLKEYKQSLINDLVTGKIKVY